MLGIDVSRHQDIHDYDALLQHVGVVVLKAGGSNYGRYVDSRYKTHAAGFASRVPVGSYWVNGAGNPVEDADFFVDNLDPRAAAFIALDIETIDGHDYWRPEQATAWIDRVRLRLPHVPILAYMNQHLSGQEDWRPLARAGALLWIASYGPNNGHRNGEPGTGTWPAGYIMHQYTDRGRLPGYDGNLDLNHVRHLNWLTTKENPFMTLTADEAREILDRVRNIDNLAHGSFAPAIARLDVHRWREERNWDRLEDTIRGVLDAKGVSGAAEISAEILTKITAEQPAE